MSEKLNVALGALLVLSLPRPCPYSGLTILDDLIKKQRPIHKKPSGTVKGKGKGIVKPGPNNARPQMKLKPGQQRVARPQAAPQRRPVNHNAPVPRGTHAVPRKTVLKPGDNIKVKVRVL